jgi:4-oxalocrotonate tautomerase
MKALSGWTVFQMPYIHVHLLEGRTEEQKAKLAKVITDAFVDITGVSKDSVWVEFSDMAKVNFATGGVLRSKSK